MAVYDRWSAAERGSGPKEDEKYRERVPTSTRSSPPAHSLALPAPLDRAFPTHLPFQLEQARASPIYE